MSLPCGHTANTICWVRDDQVSCNQKIILPFSCGHSAEITCGEDIASVQCSAPCQHLLDCGHLCLLPCHADLHHQPRCPQPCRRRARLCRADHTCPNMCHEECKPCQVIVRRALDCGHEADMACHEDPALYECTKKCPLTLDCGHQCRSLCYEPCGPCKVWSDSLELPCGHVVSGYCGNPPSCTQLVLSGQSSSCRHAVKVPCVQASAGLTLPESLPCTEVCGTLLSCGHSCTGRCADCSLGLHSPCEEPCSRTLVCGHPCDGLCGALCPPCSKVTGRPSIKVLMSILQKCPLRCPHGPCKARCGEECSPCKEKCSWRCQHKKCTKKCKAPCTRTPCQERCQTKLSCGHQCHASCGELCFCVQCETGQSQSTADLIKLPCQCVVNIENLAEETSKVEMLKCPNCGQTVTFSHQLKQIIVSRYERVQRLSEIFFAQHLKIGERKRILLANCQNENSVLFSSMIKTLKEPKIPISNSALFMLETKYELYRILENCDEIRKKIIEYRIISIAVIREIMNLDFITEAMRLKIHRLKIYSYQAGIWSWCSNCSDVFQMKCYNCDISER